MSIHKAADCINGKFCKIFATIDGNVEEIAIAKTIEATVEKTKEEIRVMGDLWTQHKATGLSGSGTMTLYYCSPLFRKMMVGFEKTKKDSYFTMTIISNDEGSNAGTQTVILNDVNINSTVAAKGDVDAILDEEIPFTFSGWSFPSHFNDSLV